MKESTVEAYLKARVEALGGRCVKLNPLGAVGLPDRLVLLRGEVWLVEVKKPKGGRLSEKQKHWARWLYENGLPHKVIWTKEGTDDFIDDYRQRAQLLGDRAG